MGLPCQNGRYIHQLRRTRPYRVRLSKPIGLHIINPSRRRPALWVESSPSIAGRSTVPIQAGPNRNMASLTFHLRASRRSALVTRFTLGHVRMKYQRVPRNQKDLRVVDRNRRYLYDITVETLGSKRRGPLRYNPDLSP